MPSLKFIVLDVGQGTGNYVEVTEDNGTVYPILIDLGSEGWKTEAGLPSAKLVAEHLMKLKPPTLSAVFLSHSDSDHINLLIPLLGYFDTPRTVNPTKPVLTVHRVCYGGDPRKYVKRGKNYLLELDKYRPLNVGTILEPVANDASSFAGGDPSNWKPWASFGGAQIWLLVGNVVSETVVVYEESPTGSQPAEGYAINTRSLVLVVTAGTNQFVMTGDATGMTLARCNEWLKNAEVRKYVANVFDLTLPHHGSETTTFDLLGATSDDMDAEELADVNVQDFVDYVKPQTISASAGERSTFRHPASRVIDAFSTHLDGRLYFADDALKALNQHFYTAFFPRRVKKLNVSPGTWPSNGAWYTARTAANIFSTDYWLPEQFQADYVVLPPAPATSNAIASFKPRPPRAVAWGIEVDGAGNRQIYKAASRAEVMALLPPEAVDRLVRGPLTDEFVWIRSAHLDPPDEADEPKGATRIDAEAPPPRATPRRLLPGLRQLP
jgi:beta-lactamase superfamily II metal-dependent hydrolase